MQGKEKERLEQERAALEKVRPVLEANQPVRSMDLTVDEEAVLRGFAFLTQKPILYLVNCPDVAEAMKFDAAAALGERAGRPKAGAAALAGPDRAGKSPNSPPRTARLFCPIMESPSQARNGSSANATTSSGCVHSSPAAPRKFTPGPFARECSRPRPPA